MSDPLVPALDTSIELSEQELEAVAGGGFALAGGSATAMALGRRHAITYTDLQIQTIADASGYQSSGRASAAAIAD
jgi:hypothetical protein